MIIQVIFAIAFFALSIGVLIFLGKLVGDIETKRKERWYRYMEISVLSNIMEGIEGRMKKYPEEVGREKELLVRLLKNLKDDYAKQYGNYL
jgi:hypothetical protein